MLRKSLNLTVLLELRSRKTVRFSKQIMSAEKYLSIFSRQMEAIVYIFVTRGNRTMFSEIILSNAYQQMELTPKVSICSLWTLIRVFMATSVSPLPWSLLLFRFYSACQSFSLHYLSAVPDPVLPWEDLQFPSFNPFPVLCRDLFSINASYKSPNNVVWLLFLKIFLLAYSYWCTSFPDTPQDIYSSSSRKRPLREFKKVIVIGAGRLRE